MTPRTLFGAAAWVALGLVASPASAQPHPLDEGPRQASDRIAPPRGVSAHGGGYAETRSSARAVPSPQARECTDICESEEGADAMRACVIECVRTFGYREAPSPGTAWIGAGLLATAMGFAALIAGMAGVCDKTAGPEPDAVPAPSCRAALLASGTSLSILGPVLVVVGVELNDDRPDPWAREATLLPAPGAASGATLTWAF